MSTTFALGLTADLELPDEQRAELCLRFVQAGWTRLLHEVVGARVLRVTPQGFEWLPERLGAKYRRHAEEAGGAGWSNSVEMPAYFCATDLIVPTKRAFFEQPLDLPGTPLHGLKLSSGGHIACYPLWDRQRELQEEAATQEAALELRTIKGLLTLLAVGRSYHMVVRAFF